MAHDDDRTRPKQTSGPSLPIEGPQPRQSFNAGVFPGRDTPGAGQRNDPNPYARIHRSPYGGGDQSEQTDPRSSFSPMISLPSGGGALRSIGEKFSPNPFTGTGSTAVPIATSPGRGGFGPLLSLSYGSGQGNGPWGLGWSLSVPMISRKTEKGLPEYMDKRGKLYLRDTFILAGAEDLVQELDDQGDAWRREQNGYLVHRYRPRVESGFARIERWTSQSTDDIYWRTISADNVTSYYGRTAAARVCDPAKPRRVFSWLLEESHDDRGNIIVYEYKQEDLAGVNVRAPEEAPRLATTAIQPQRYLSRIKYGNAQPFVAEGWLFEVVLDYGEFGEWHDDQLEIGLEPMREWPARLDTFSTYRPGFEVRTRRLCRRVLMFHRFPELGEAPCLVASTDFMHAQDPAVTRLTGVVQRSYRRDPNTGWYESAVLPMLEFEYSDASLDPVLHEIKDPVTRRNLPSGIDGRMTRLVDLDGEGVPGLITEAAGTWYYKRGLGDGRFGPMMALPSRPTTLGVPGVQLMDLDGDGRKELVSFAAPAAGFFRRTADEGWGNFRKFTTIPNIDWQDPRVQLIDLSGDGFPDVLIDRGDWMAWYRSKGADGFEPPRKIPNDHVGTARPVLVLNSARTSIHFADMTGDGLPDLVRVRNGEVVYWPCLGFGRFGKMIRMRGLGRGFSKAGNLFDPSRLRLADVDGSGTTDIIYIDDDGASLYRNLCGNRFAGAVRIEQFPGLRGMDWVEVMDLKGNGTGCLVWSTPSRGWRDGMLRYIELTGGQKPHLLVGVKNNMGAETRVRYAPSTQFYLADKAAGKPWVTKLPFPVHVVERVESIDHVTRQRYVQHFAYHHGYFDGQEREFRGFGLVETWDTESFEDFSHEGLFAFEQFDVAEEKLHQPPVYTKSWFHTGAYLGRGKLSRLFAGEYWSGDSQAWALPDSKLPPGLNGEDAREAVRALAGRTLRTEVYALDGSENQGVPYAVTEANFEVRQLQGRGEKPFGRNRFGIYLAHERETLSWHYERNADDPRVGHTVVLEVDDYGTVLRSAAIAYPRRGVPAEPEQGKLHVTLSEAAVVHLDGGDDVLRLGVPIESRSYEVHGLVAPGSSAFSWQALHIAAGAATAVAYDGQLTGGVDKRLLARTRMRYLADDLSGPLPHGVVESKALAYDSDAMAMTETQRQAVFGQLTGAPSNAELEVEGKYVFDDDAWWVRTGHPTYSADRFYAVTAMTDPYGNAYSATYDQHALLVLSSTDPLGNTLTTEYDYRVLAPRQITDVNGNRSQVAFDVLGLVVASAVMGKVGDNDGDTLEDPTSTFEYDLFAWQTSGKLNWAKTRIRETHQDPSTRWLEQRTYFSGSGSVVMVKAQARPGLAAQRDQDGQLVLDQNGDVVLADTSPDLRWVGNGRVVKDNKGNVVKAYEPYYSSTPDYEDEAELVEQGVTAINHYDPLGRLIRTDLPNGTFSKVEFNPWQQTSWDVNDTVLDSEWYAARAGYPGQDVALVKERRAAELAAKHANTPTTVHLDTLGRPFLSVAHNKTPLDQAELIETRSVLDVQGNVLDVIDGRGNSAEERVLGMLGQSLEVISVDAGDRWHLLTALGQPMRSWDSRDQRFSYTYDELRRPVDRTVSVDGGPEKLLGRVVYGELLESPATTNHRGRVYRVHDGASVATTNAFDFKGHAVTEQRQLVAQHTDQADWSALLGQGTVAAMTVAAAPLLDSETFSASSQRDALGRVLVAISPDNSEVAYSYDEGGGLQRVELRHRGSQVTQTVVGDVTYNARGQRETVINGPANSPTTTTTYAYDPQTYRLTHLTTVRGSDQAALQGLHYHYDPAGNITDIRDTAQQTVYYANAVVEAANSYEYDALYRLIEATGREHASQDTEQRTHAQLPVGPQPMTSDPSAMRRYTQRFTYDVVGNILKMQHIAGGSGWTRHYQYAQNGNRLLATSAPGDNANGPYSHTYDYDAHGSMTTMPHLAAVDWNHDDQLVHATAGTEQVYFQYAGGIRARKFTEKSGSITEERIYLGPFEIYRKRINGALHLERESLHISDGSGRICIIETKTVADGAPVQNPTPVWRYQLTNHLGSAATEVTQDGSIISYEEYHPYGTSAYRAVDASIDVSAKRYRYTGMERDEETGLSYHSARYCVPWLGLWTATDPLGIGADISRWRYSENNPIALADPSGLAPPSAAEVQALREDVETTRREAIATAKQLLREAREELRSAESVLANLHDSPIELREKAAAHYRNAEINYAAAMDRLDLVKQIGFLPWDQVGQLQTVKLLALEQQRSISEDAALLAANYDPNADAGENRRQFWHEVAEGTAEQFGITDAAELVEAGVVFVESPDWGTAANLGEKAVPVVAMAVGPKIKGPKAKVPKGKASNNARALPKRKAADDGHSIAYEPARDSISTIEREWQAWDITDARSRSGCEDIASQIKDHIGGEIFRIEPAGAPSLGPYRGKGWGWAHHDVVVRDGRVYDAFTGHEGMPISEYKALWTYADHINFGF